jgi:hypothetical protein
VGVGEGELDREGALIDRAVLRDDRHIGALGQRAAGCASNRSGERATIVAVTGWAKTLPDDGTLSEGAQRRPYVSRIG